MTVASATPAKPKAALATMRAGMRSLKARAPPNRDSKGVSPMISEPLVAVACTMPLMKQNWLK